MTTTIERCQALLAEFHKAIAPSNFPAYDYAEPGGEDAKQLSAWRLASDPIHWTELESNDASSPHFGGVMSATAAAIPQFRIRSRDSHGDLVQTWRPFTDFAIQREFVCAEDKLDTSLRCFVLEDFEGRLFVGEDTGD